MRINAEARTYRGTIARIVDFLEYLFVFVIIAECNSMFSSVQMADMKSFDEPMPAVGIF